MENLWYCAVNEYVKYPIPRTIPSTSRQVVLEKLWSRYYLKLVKTSSGFSRQFICLYFSYNFLLAFSWDFLEWMGKIFNATIRPRLESFMDSNIWNIWILIIWFCLVIEEFLIDISSYTYKHTSLLFCSIYWDSSMHLMHNLFWIKMITWDIVNYYMYLKTLMLRWLGGLFPEVNKNIERHFLSNEMHFLY